MRARRDEIDRAQAGLLFSLARWFPRFYASPLSPLGFASFFWKMKPPVRDRLLFLHFLQPLSSETSFFAKPSKSNFWLEFWALFKNVPNSSGEGGDARKRGPQKRLEAVGAFLGFSVSLARRFPRFCASPPSPLEFGTFLKSAQNSSQKLLFDGLSKIDVSLERGCKKCKNAHCLEREASFSQKTTQTRAADGVAHRIVEITERVKTEGRQVPGRSRLYGPSARGHGKDDGSVTSTNSFK